MKMSLTEFIMASWDGYALQGKWIFTPPMVYSTEDVAMFFCSCFTGMLFKNGNTSDKPITYNVILGRHAQ